MGRSQLASVLFLLSKMRHLHKVECRKVGWIPMHRFIRKLFVKSKLRNCYNYGSEAPAVGRVLNTIYFEKQNDQLRKEKFHLWNGKGRMSQFLQSHSYRVKYLFLATLQKDQDFSRQSCFSMAWCIETEVSSSGFHERLISERQNQNKKNNDFKMNPSFLS